jgi:cyclase
MNNVRVIARLDIKGPNLVKGIHLEGLRVLGKPADFAKYYYEAGADELIYQDVVASLYDRNSLSEIIEESIKDVFIPLTVGGGLRSIEDINKVLRAGADKVSINTAAIKNPEFIKEASEKFGSSTIVISIECIRQSDGRYLVFIDNGREHTGIEVGEWAQQVQSLGAGEVILTSVDREGTGLGFDLDLVRNVSGLLTIPLIVHGGAGKMQHVSEILGEEGVDAVALSSLLHYDYIKSNAANLDNRSEGNVDFLKSGRNFGKIDSCSIQSLKTHLTETGIACRR